MSDRSWGSSSTALPPIQDSPMTLKDSSMTLKDPSMTPKDSSLTLKDPSMALKDSSLTLKDPSMTPKDSSLRFAESSKNFYHSKPARISPSLPCHLHPGLARGQIFCVAIARPQQLLDKEGARSPPDRFAIALSKQIEKRSPLPTVMLS